MRQMLWVIALCLLNIACGPRYANLPPEPPASFQLAEKRLRIGEHERAAEGFSLFLAQTVDPTFRPRGYYGLAQAQFALGEHRQAIDTLDLMYAEFAGEVWYQASAVRGDAQYALGNRTEAFLAWEESWAYSTAPDRGLIERRMEAAVPELREEELIELSELVTITSIYAMIGEYVPPGVGAIASAQGMFPEQLGPPEDEMEIAEEAGAILGAEGEVVAGLHRAELVPVPPVKPLTPDAKIACLLPLTGPDNTYGARVLSGLRLAFEDAPELLTVRDTGGDPEIAAALFQELVSSPSILGVIGPLRTNVAEAVAGKATEAELPMLSLAQGEGIAGRFVFPISVTRMQQVQTLVVHATNVLHARHFGVVYPDDGYGRRFRELFKDAVRAHGGQVVGSLSYVPGQPDFVAEAATVRRWSRERQLDAVFIPDGARTASKLSTEIRVEVPDLVLLGTESWNRPAVIAQTADWLEGAMFADAFFAGSIEPSTRTFVERFLQRNGRVPTAFEAQAFDAGMILRQAIDAGAVTRSDTVRLMLAMGRFSGAGRLTVSGEGFDRELFLLRVHAGRIEEVLTASDTEDMPG